MVVPAVGLLMLLGLAGTLIPLVPGLPLIWGAALLYGWSEGWDSTAWVSIALISVFMVVGIVAKVALPHKKVSESGAPRSTLIAGAVAGVVGFFLIPVIGLPLGAVAGVLLAEFRRTQDLSKAWISTKGAIVGFGLGALVEIGAGLAMIATWVAWVLL